MYEIYIFLIGAFPLEEGGIEKQTDICKLQKVVGPCEALTSKYFYNTETRQCEEFKYGGCDGNANNFETIEECRVTCQSAGNQ